MAKNWTEHEVDPLEEGESGAVSSKSRDYTLLENVGRFAFDPFEIGDSKIANVGEFAANRARAIALHKMFGPMSQAGKVLWEKFMGKAKKGSWDQADPSSVQSGRDLYEDEYGVQDDWHEEGYDPNVDMGAALTELMEFDTPELSEFDPSSLFDAAGSDFLEGAGPDDSSFDPISGGDAYGWDDDMGIPPAPPPPTWSGMDPYSEMAVSPSYGTGERLMKEPTIQDIINSMEDPRDKAAIFNELRNPFSDPGMHEAFAPGADISIDQPFDPRGGPGRFADMGMGGGINDLISRGAALEGTGGGGGGGVGNAMYLY